MNAKTRVAIVSVLLPLSWAGSARAGGISLPIRGVRALSMGGAYVAGADGVNALWYNPARIDETTLGLEVGVVALSAGFTPSGGEQAGLRVANEAGVVPNPTLGFILHVTDMLSIGVGAYAPYAGHGRFDETGPQRYSLVDNDQSTIFYLDAGAALRFGRFRIGGGLQNVSAHLKQRVVLSGYSGIFGNPEDPELDILEEIELQDPINLTGNIGASFDAGPLTLALAVQLPYRIAGQADFRVRLPSSVFFDSMEVDGSKVDLEIPFPLAVRGGAAWRISPRFGMEVAVNYENWSVQDKITIDPGDRIMLHGVPAIGDYRLPPLVIDRRMKDTISLHIGADYQILSSLHLRTGMFYEPSAFGDETFSVAQLDDDKVGIALGASYDAGLFRFDVGFSRVLQGTREITASEIKQLNPTNPDQAIVVGNGTYDSNYWVGGAGVSCRFGAE